MECLGDIEAMFEAWVRRWDKRLKRIDRKIALLITPMLILI